MLPSIGKVFEKKIETTIRDYLEKNNKLYDLQFGFRREKSTIHPLAILQNKINEGLNYGNITSILLLDIQAAFDCVWHAGLIHKMISEGIDLRLCKLVNLFTASSEIEHTQCHIMESRHNPKRYQMEFLRDLP